MADLRRALRNAVQLLEREASLRRLSVEGGAEEFAEDARTLTLELVRHTPENLQRDPVDLEPLL